MSLYLSFFLFPLFGLAEGKKIKGKSKKNNLRTIFSSKGAFYSVEPFFLLKSRLGRNQPVSIRTVLYSFITCGSQSPIPTEPNKPGPFQG